MYSESMYSDSPNTIYLVALLTEDNAYRASYHWV